MARKAISSKMSRWRVCSAWLPPWVIANALIRLHRALIGYTHRQALAGVPNRRIARNLIMHGKRALDLLHGIGAARLP
jgi:hypothetical protein